jgi:hypothetical protein
MRWIIPLLLLASCTWIINPVDPDPPPPPPPDNGAIEAMVGHWDGLFTADVSFAFRAELVFELDVIEPAVVGVFKLIDEVEPTIGSVVGWYTNGVYYFDVVIRDDPYELAFAFHGHLVGNRLSGRFSSIEGSDGDVELVRRESP